MAWTTDSWTSKSTDSYVTITAHYCKDFQLKSAVLQTRLLPSAHTGENVGLVLKGAAVEWSCNPMCVTTDNASNMTIAARVAEIPLHLGCFAHTINLASCRGVAVPIIHGVLAKMRSVVALFHRSTTAASLLKTKQGLLQLPEHKLIIDVKTRWNSSYLMVQRYIEQQVAILATFTDDKLSKSIKALIGESITPGDFSNAETFIKLMEPMYRATLAISEDSKPTVGIILPLLGKLKAHYSPQESDNACAKAIKKAVLTDLNKRYQDEKVVHFLEATAYDARFKHMTPTAVWDRVIETASELKQLQPSAPGQAEPLNANLPTASVPVREQLPPPKKKAALSFLFDDETLITNEEPPLSALQQAQREVESYKTAPRPATNTDPLSFWKDMAIKYPILCQIAPRYLCC